MKLIAAITILTAIAWLITGCCRYQKIPPSSPKFDTGPDTYFEGPDWIPHDQRTIGESVEDYLPRKAATPAILAEKGMNKRPAGK